MRQIRLDFSDETDKVLVDSQGNQVSSNDLLAVIRCMTTVILTLAKKHNISPEDFLVKIGEAVTDGYERYKKCDILENPDDLSPWRKEENE